MERLTAGIAHYDWGSPHVIPDLLGIPADGRPWAEMWIGTHPAVPSHVPDGRTLADVTGELPFLMKVLAAAEPLSVQAHPAAAVAAIGFAEENAAGLSAADPARNYRDPHGKPELLYAIAPTALLAGFREPAGTRELLGALRDRAVAAPTLEVLDELADRLPADGDLREAFTAVYGFAAGQLVPAVAGLTDAAVAVSGAGGSFAAEARWIAAVAARHPGDPGVLAATLLNLVQLSPGEAIVLPAGVVHAYLSGAGVEVMGASDNVLRGGLTRKRVDVTELLRVADVAAHRPRVVRAEPVAPGVARVESPSPAFGVQVLSVRPSADLVLPAGGDALLLVLSGDVTVTVGTHSAALPSGGALHLGAAEAAVVSGSGQAVLAHDGVRPDGAPVDPG